MENRKSRASVIFLSLAGTPVDSEHEREKYRVPQFHHADLDVLGLFMSRTERRRPAKFKFILIGEADELVEEFFSAASSYEVNFT